MTLHLEPAKRTPMRRIDAAWKRERGLSDAAHVHAPLCAVDARWSERSEAQWTTHLLAYRAGCRSVHPGSARVACSSILRTFLLSSTSQRYL